jgi:uncharacterized protein (DUF2237 family)
VNVVLTICSANYLAHAKVLGDSLARSNPDYQFVIGLVDRVPAEIKLAGWLSYEVIPVTDLGIPEFPAMAEKYDIVELNTAVKPFYLEFLYQRNPAVKTVMYLDPDILVLGSFNALAEKLHGNNIVVTPHSCTHDNSAVNFYYETAMLSTGIYNLGFIATTRAETTFAFLKWWQKRLVDHCYYRAGSGVFVDQLWVTLATLYFEGVYVEKDPGYNMCYWNHFERRLSHQDNHYMVNGNHDLVFYHFSSYSPLNPGVITNRASQPVMTFAERPDLQPLYDDYGKRLFAAGFALVRPLKCAFGRKPKPTPKPKLSVKTAVQGALKRTLNATPAAIRKRLHQISGFIAENSEG